MSLRLQEIFKLVTPPVVTQIAKRLRSNRSMTSSCLSTGYCNWGEAMAASTGYNNEIILEKTKAALLKVKNGEVVYERDSVLFDSIQYSWTLLAGLMWVAARCGGTLNVLDFGGSLGSTYFQNRTFLSSLPKVHWNIVEQPAHVKIGKELFEDEHLKFFESVEECLSLATPNVVILSSVLQYLETPYNLLNTILTIPSVCIIIDRTPYSNEDHDKLCTQHVDPKIFTASYPMWIFSLSKFKFYLKDFVLVQEFESFENGLFGLLWKGFIIARSG